MFGAGTACVVCPIEHILYKDKDLYIPTMDSGAEVASRCYQELTDIQVSMSLNSCLHFNCICKSTGPYIYGKLSWPNYRSNVQENDFKSCHILKILETKSFICLCPLFKA